MSEAPLLALENLHAGYGRIEVLHGVSIEVRAGELVTLIGSNGAGKSTTLLAVMGVLDATVGVVRLAGEDLTHVPTHRRAARGMSLVPEGRGIFPRLSVEENLRMGAYLRRDADGISSDLERMEGLFPILHARRTQVAGTLSGGELQMLAIARALMARPKILLLDEPSLGLAPLMVAKVFEVIRRLHHEGTTILLVEQNARLALESADRGYVMVTGRIELAGNAKDLLADDEVHRLYLGG